MPTTPPTSRVLAAVVGGLASTAYYATPDVIRSRTGRGWAKAALTGVVLASSLPDLRRSLAENRARQADEVADRALRDLSVPGEAAPDDAAPDDAAPGEDVPGAGVPGNTVPVAGLPGVDPEDGEHVDWRALWSGMSTRGRVTVTATAALGTVLSVASVVAVERAVFRRGERRRAAGVRYAHTRPALLWGALTTVLALLPDDVGARVRGTSEV